MKNICLLAFALFFFGGCSGVIDSLREESEEADRDSRREDQFNGHGVAGAPRSRLSRGLSANSTADYAPGAIRNKDRAMNDAFDEGAEQARKAAGNLDEAISEAVPKRRYSRADFVDNNSNENSLWNAQGQSNYYFSQNNRFDQGDLVIISVDRSLRREIQYALWKSLPSEQRRIKRKRDPASEDGKEKPGVKPKEGESAEPQAKTAKQTEAEERAAAEDAAKGSMGADKDNDLVRMEIVENLGNGLVRLQGEKRVIYRGRPKFVEVSALIRGRDIDDQAKANSKQFLDMRTRVIQ